MSREWETDDGPRLDPGRRFSVKIQAPVTFHSFMDDSNIGLRNVLKTFVLSIIPFLVIFIYYALAGYDDGSVSDILKNSAFFYVGSSALIETINGREKGVFHFICEVALMAVIAVYCCLIVTGLPSDVGVSIAVTAVCLALSCVNEMTKKDGEW